MTDTALLVADRDGNFETAVGLHESVANGLLYTHSRLNANTRKTLESASFLYALVELLAEKGLITVEELDARKQVVGERLVEQFREQGMGALFQDPEYDKYAFEQRRRDRLRQPRPALPGRLLPAALCPLQTGRPRGGRALGPGPALPDRTGRGRLLHPPGPGHLCLHHLRPPARALPGLRLPPG